MHEECSLSPLRNFPDKISEISCKFAVERAAEREVCNRIDSLHAAHSRPPSLFPTVYSSDTSSRITHHHHHGAPWEREDQEGDSGLPDRQGRLLCAVRITLEVRVSVRVWGILR